MCQQSQKWPNTYNVPSVIIQMTQYFYKTFQKWEYINNRWNKQTNKQVKKHNTAIS